MIINQYQNYMYNSKLLEEKFIKNSNNNFTILKDNLYFRNITLPEHANIIDPKTKVYKGMIVGEHNRDNDLEVNVLKGKKLTNVRASGSDQAIILTPPRKMTLEQMMAYMADDELLEVTPMSLRLRKKILLSHLRKRAS